MKFNRNKPYGTITPPYQGALYQQGNHYYDGDYKRISKLSEKITLRDVLPIDKAPVGTEETKLIMMAEDSNVTWQEFRKESRKILDECPTTKEKIVEALKDQIVYTIMDRISGGSPTPIPTDEQSDDDFQGMTWDSEKAGKKAAPPPPPDDNEEIVPDEADLDGPDEINPNEKHVAEEANDGPVDLASWGRGKMNYLFSDVQKEIRTRFSRQVVKQSDAVDLLIDEGVIAVVEAMKVVEDG